MTLVVRQAQKSTKNGPDVHSMTLVVRQAQNSTKNGPDIQYDPYPETSPEIE